MKRCEDSFVVVCGIVRNAEKGLRRNLPIIDKVLTQFKGFCVFIYENDSTDDTKKILQDWQSKNEGRVYVSLNQTDPTKTIPSAKNVNGVNPFFSHKRIDKMARIRNNYMDWLIKAERELFTCTPDYLIIVDLDVAQLDANSIMTSFESNVDWDAVCSFGYSTSPKLKRRYHDTFALTKWEERYEPQTEEKIKRYADELGSLKPSDKWIRLASGFGGLAIYRYEAIKGLRYTEPAIDNHDKRVEAKCEHFSIYKQMIERGHDRIYLNPAMTLKYQDLTLGIVWNSLLRKIGIK